MSIRPDQTRNAHFNKERARVQYANRRLSELRAEGVADDTAWETIGAELKSGAADDCGGYRASAACAGNAQCRVAIAKATGSAAENLRKEAGEV